MRGINYENGYLVMLLSSVINDKKILLFRIGRFIGRTFLKLAEFHDIISPIYYGVLGLGKRNLAERDSEEFYRKYHKELLLGEGYKDALEVIAWQMEKNKINGDCC